MSPVSGEVFEILRVSDDSSVVTGLRLLSLSQALENSSFCVFRSFLHTLLSFAEELLCRSIGSLIT